MSQYITERNNVLTSKQNESKISSPSQNETAINEDSKMSDDITIESFYDSTLNESFGGDYSPEQIAQIKERVKADRDSVLQNFSINLVKLKTGISYSSGVNKRLL